MTYNNYMDMRLFYSSYLRTDWSACRWDPSDASVPRFYRVSPLTGVQICYTPDALMYAQSAFFIAAVLTQIANNLVCRTRFLGLGEQGIGNAYANFSFLFEICLGIFLIYIPPIEYAINTRAIAIAHFMIPGVTFAVFIFLYDETRKVFVRRGIERTVSPEGTMIKYRGWIARNTYY